MSKQTHICPVPGGYLKLDEFGAQHGPVLLVLGGISGGREVWHADGSGWWQDLFTAVDLQQFTVLSVDYAGGTGESHVQPAPTSIEQQAALIAAALEHLQLTHLGAVIGGSYGGLVALALSQLPQLTIERLVVIAAAHRSSHQAVLLRYLQRQFIRLGDAAGEPLRGLQLARAMAMMSYRSSAAFDDYYGSAQAVIDYVEGKGLAHAQQQPQQARAWFECFGPALDQFSCQPAQIQQPVLLIGFATDQLVEPRLLEDFAEQLPRVQRCLALPSSYGHDGFIKSVSSYAAALSDFLRGAVADD